MKAQDVGAQIRDVWDELRKRDGITLLDFLITVTMMIIILMRDLM